MYVSNHAAVRWFERVEGIDLGPVRKAVADAGLDPNNDGYILNQIWHTFGISVEDIADWIATPFVRAAVAAGAWRIHVGSAVLQVKDGVVTTVITSGMRENGLQKFNRSARPDTRREQRLIRNRRMAERS